MMLNKKEPEVFTYEEAAAYIEEIPKFTKNIRWSTQNYF